MLAVVWIICIIIFVIFMYLIKVLPAKRYEKKIENHLNNTKKTTFKHDDK